MRSATSKKRLSLDPLSNERIVNGLSIVYDLLRRYDDEAALFDRFAAVKPSTRNYAQLIRAQIETERGDLKAAHSFLVMLPPDYDPDGQRTWTGITLALFERDTMEAARILGQFKKEELVGATGRLVPVSYWQGMIARAKGDEAKVREAFSQARTAIESQLAGQPNDPMLLATLGLLDAGLSRKEDAVREGRRAVELCPLAEDADDGATVLSSLAMIYAWTGDINAAIEHLQFLAKTPGGPPFGYLKYDPAWDAVRNDPRFEAMLKSIAPR